MTPATVADFLGTRVACEVREKLAAGKKGRPKPRLRHYVLYRVRSRQRKR
jgi:hypothetical protein